MNLTVIKTEHSIYYKDWLVKIALATQAAFIAIHLLKMHIYTMPQRQKTWSSLW